MNLSGKTEAGRGFLAYLVTDYLADMRLGIVYQTTLKLSECAAWLDDTHDHRGLRQVCYGLNRCNNSGYDGDRNKPGQDWPHTLKNLTIKNNTQVKRPLIREKRTPKGFPEMGFETAPSYFLGTAVTIRFVNPGLCVKNLECDLAMTAIVGFVGYETGQ